VDALELKSLVAQGETIGVEFKEDKDHQLDSESLILAVVGMANAEGGLIIIGVQDRGSITGVGLKTRNLNHGDPIKLEGYLRNQTTPPLSVTAQFVDVDGKTVVVINVPQSDEPVSSLKGTYRRRTIGPDGQPKNAAYTLSQMLSKRIMVMEQDYATVPLPRARLDELSPVEFDDFRRRAAQPSGDQFLADLPNLGILQALRLVRIEDGNPVLTVGAVLLFGTESTVAKYVPTAEVAFQALDGTLLARNDIKRLPLFRAADFLFTSVEETLVTTAQPELSIGMQRISLPPITPAAIRECVANALIHRDYTILRNVTVQITAAGARVTSPGGLPQGITLSNLLEETRPRSLALVDAFRRAGYVERTGRGVARMYADQLRNGRAAPSYSGTTFDQVSVSFATSRADTELALFFHQWESSNRPALEARDLQVIRSVRDLRDPTTEELSERLALPPDTTRHLARRLEDLGCLEIRGRGSGRHYVLSSLITTMTRGLSAYVPTIEQAFAIQKEMILSVVKSAGSISRAQVVDLCKISPAAAARTLRELVRTGELEMKGSKRGTHYTLSNTA
jgi:ATP-dependent DNA helicase RecG